jgi:hypothetical protein
VQVAAGVAGATEVTEQLSPVPAVAVYAMMVTPPSLAGGVQATATEPLPGVPLTPVGWPGATPGVVTVAEAADATPSPTELVAVTVNVWLAAAASPLIVQVVAGVAGAVEVTEQVSPVPAVAVYRVMVAPPSVHGVAHDTTTEALVAAVPVTLWGE